MRCNVFLLGPVLVLKPDFANWTYAASERSLLESRFFFYAEFLALILVVNDCLQRLGFILPFWRVDEIFGGAADLLVSSLRTLLIFVLAIF